MGDRLHGTFPTIIWKPIHSLDMDYVSKWVEAIACPRNEANIVVGFIQRNILSKFRAQGQSLVMREANLQTSFLQN